jgi:hypothetical protein
MTDESAPTRPPRSTTPATSLLFLFGFIAIVLESELQARRLETPYVRYFLLFTVVALWYSNYRTLKTKPLQHTRPRRPTATVTSLMILFGFTAIVCDLLRVKRLEKPSDLPFFLSFVVIALLYLVFTSFRNNRSGTHLSSSAPTPPAEE